MEAAPLSHVQGPAKTAVARLPLHGPTLRRALAVLWSVDLLFIGSYVAYRLLAKALDLGQAPAWLEVSSDQGLPEHLNFVKWAMAAAALIVAALARRRLLYAALAAVVAVLLSDDSMQLHERIGYWLDHHYQLLAELSRGGLNAGELTYWTLVGVPLLAVTAIAALRARGRDRGFVLLILALLLALGLAGIGLDILSTLLGHRIEADTSLSLVSAGMFLLEDGSEMLLISALCASCLSAAAYWRNQRRLVGAGAAE